MWNKWLTLRVKVKGKKSVNVWLPPLSLYVLRHAILSADGLLGLIGGGAGRKARAASDLMQKSLAVLQDEGMDVDVKVTNPEEDIRVRIHTV